MTQFNVTSIAAAAMIGSLNISVWEGRKKDKKVEEEVTAAKGARSKRALSAHKQLFADCPALESIKALRGEVRQWFNNCTLPWDDNGGRIITTAQYFEVMHDFARYQTRFSDLVKIFVSVYNTEISKQAFELGAMFDRSEYPDVNEVALKFRMDMPVRPLPLAGDFRVDIGQEALEQLKAQHDKMLEQQLSLAVADAWNRVKTQVEWVRDRMTAVLDHDPDAVEELKEFDEAGNLIKVDIKKKRRPKIHESMLDTGIELCSLLRDLNITNDPKLEEARRMMESTLMRLDMDSLKESKEVQESTKKAMQDILDKFSL